MDPELPEALLEAGRGLVTVFLQTLGEGRPGVTLVQQRVLVALSDHGPLTVGDVADLLRVDQSTASRHVSGLAREGLVERRKADHDGRAVEVSLSTDGAAQVAAVRRARLRRIGDALEQLPPQQARAAVEGLRAFARAVEDAVTGPRHP